MNWTLHPGAEQDNAAALDFYNEHAGPRVAQSFLNEVHRVANLLAERPGLGSLTTKGRRIFPMRVFP